MQKTSTRGIVIVLLLLLTSVSSYAQSGRRNILIYVLSDRYEDDRWRDWYRNPAHLDGIVDDLQSIGFRCEVIDRKIGPSLPISRLHEFSQVWISECDNDAVLDTTMQEVTALHEFCMTGGGVWLSMEGTLYGGSDDWKEDIVPYAESFGCEWVGNHYGSYPRAVAPSAHPVLYHIKWLHFNSEVGALASSSGQMESIWDYATGFTGIMVTDGFRLGEGRRLVDA